MTETSTQGTREQAMMSRGFAVTRGGERGKKEGKASTVLTVLDDVLRHRLRSSELKFGAALRPGGRGTGCGEGGEGGLLIGVDAEARGAGNPPE